MGYYSDVSFVTTPAGHELLQANKEKFGFDELLVEFDSCGSFEIEHEQISPFDFFHYYWSYTKWYESYPDVGSFVKFVHSEQFSEPFVLTRFGEDFEDIERCEKGDTELLPYVDIKHSIEFLC